MKHETTTLMTKRALASSLKKIMEKKPLSKISVREIIEDCGVNRKTFYYHFQDIYALVKWIFEEEAIEVVKQYDLIVDYVDAIRFTLNYVEENKVICNCAFDALGRDELKRFFQKDFFSFVENIITQLSEGKNIPEDFKEFLITIYTESLASLLIEWLRNKEDRDREKFIRYISIAFYGTIEQVLSRAETELSPPKRLP
ncbi:transcriptional regulator, TetR family [Anaerocolumna jejuensis DSM 15929]|uniref:Transcriptional regulator, TetR family n=1 Tax=Anaerocolumna jejuensis DSM 15929 TaxID=1121322 RepID=A0A1M6PTW5_9FIRM|nr:TetR/AcrR family transcriptional regulator C-terminal domain-containing protein [Anaerocolumna jejuensis]SHK11351.1 transcriptional regulator, TetR family [Anaerocolumna jejuensis DSM 15929]